MNDMNESAEMEKRKVNLALIFSILMCLVVIVVAFKSEIIGYVRENYAIRRQICHSTAGPICEDVISTSWGLKIVFDCCECTDEFEVSFNWPEK